MKPEIVTTTIITPSNNTILVRAWNYGLTGWGVTLVNTDLNVTKVLGPKYCNSRVAFGYAQNFVAKNWSN